MVEEAQFGSWVVNRSLPRDEDTENIRSNCPEAQEQLSYCSLHITLQVYGLTRKHQEIITWGH